VTDAGRVRGRTRVAGIIGHPVEHSRSPAIWNAGFSALRLDWVFVAFPAPPGRAAAALDGVRALGIAGLTVTMPHKADAAEACDRLTATATRLGAVNAVVVRDGELVGDSTDGEGLVRSLRDEGVDAAGRRCLVLGAGGAARAIALALGDAGATVVVAARRADAAAVAAALAPGGEAIGLADIDDRLDAVDVVVNATPLGMDGEPPPFDPGRLRTDQLVVDTVYHPVETPLLAMARARGVRAVNGLGMLVHQAAVSFESFTGEVAPLEVMRAAAHGAGG
jgi:shikimate dehydrogenase